jgi:hypothetical protein
MVKPLKCLASIPSYFFGFPRTFVGYRIHESLLTLAFTVGLLACSFVLVVFFLCIVVASCFMNVYGFGMFVVFNVLVIMFSQYGFCICLIGVT